MPDRLIRLLPECHADTALIRFLVPDKTLSIHCEGCPEVGNIMRSPQGNLYHFLGIVDNDRDLNKRCKGYFAAFEPVQAEHRLFVRCHPTNEQTLVILDKAIETFILWNAEQVNLDLRQYGFDLLPKRLGDQFKSPTIETDPNYLRLLTDLYIRQAPGLMTLQRILHDFATN
jgi:hypothetical protein